MLAGAGADEAGLGANRLPKGLLSGALAGDCSAGAGGLGAKILPVDGGCDAPNAGFAPNNPLGAAGGAVVSLLENKDGPVVVDGVNWNGLLGAEGSLGFFSSSPFAWVGLNASADGAEKRLDD